VKRNKVEYTATTLVSNAVATIKVERVRGKWVVSAAPAVGDTVVKEYAVKDERKAWAQAHHWAQAAADRQRASEEVVAQEQVAAATHKCARCAGTGKFITYVENGVPKGPGGPCFRCAGKGVITDADRRRNWGYDNFGVRVSA